MSATVVLERRSDVNRRSKKGDIFAKFRDKAAKHPKIEDISKLRDHKDILTKSGIELEAGKRSGTFFQMDHSVIHCKAKVDGAEVLPIEEALKRYDDLKNYFWKAVSPDKDIYTKSIYTKRAKIHQENGYFIRSFANKKIDLPIQTCLFIATEGLAQDVHNLIIAEQGSDLHVITGCATSSNVRFGLHVGVSEFYVKKGARLTFTMVHNWPDEMVVRPRTVIVLEEDATFISNYICLMPAKDLETYPMAICKGEDAKVVFDSIILAKKDSFMDIGSKVVLKGSRSSSEIVSRAVSAGGTIIARGHIVGEAKDTKGHLECRGLLLKDGGVIHAIPELEGKVVGVEMSHEAAVGKIAKEEIEYLMSRGLTEKEATALIVKGFLSLPIEGLPKSLKDELEKIIEETDKESM